MVKPSIEAVRHADDEARKTFHTALCEGDDYATAYRKGAAVFRQHMKEIAI